MEDMDKYISTKIADFKNPGNKDIEIKEISCQLIDIIAKKIMNSDLNYEKIITIPIKYNFPNSLLKKEVENYLTNALCKNWLECILHIRTYEINQGRNVEEVITITLL